MLERLSLIVISVIALIVAIYYHTKSVSIVIPDIGSPHENLPIAKVPSNYHSFINNVAVKFSESGQPMILTEDPIKPMTNVRVKRLSLIPNAPLKRIEVMYPIAAMKLDSETYPFNIGAYVIPIKDFILMKEHRRYQIDFDKAIPI